MSYIDDGTFRIRLVDKPFFVLLFSHSRLQRRSNDAQFYFSSRFAIATRLTYALDLITLTTIYHYDIFDATPIALSSFLPSF